MQITSNVASVKPLKSGRSFTSYEHRYFAGVLVPGDLDHRRSDVDAHCLVEIGCECLSEPAGTAAEVQRPASLSGQSESGGSLEERRDFATAGLEELARIPAVSPTVGIR